jgi:hypothetical protein
MQRGPGLLSAPRAAQLRGSEGPATHAKTNVSGYMLIWTVSLILVFATRVQS